jgi:hypothetical protein
VVRKLAGYLENEMEPIGTKLDMYLHHHRPDPSHAGMGFVRNMFHGLVQQVLRMDRLSTH